MKLYRELLSWIYKGKKHVRLPKTKKTFIYNGKKNFGNIPTQLRFLNKFIALEHWFTIDNYGTMEKKLWYYGKKLWYYTKNMVLYRKL